MNLCIHRAAISSGLTIAVSGSKSETNRLLLLQARYPELQIENVSDSDDAIAMRQALAQQDDLIDIHHAGTAMRFLTAYFATTPGRTVTLTGSARMQQRPIGILVDALRQLGAQIEYLQNEGFPPLRISGAALSLREVRINANTSSQFLSALLLVAPKLENGLKLTLEGVLTSRPYLEMTLGLLRDIGVAVHFEASEIKVMPQPHIGTQQLTIESDWSSASYWYSMVALSPVGTEIGLKSYKAQSFQGDSALVGLYAQLGVASRFDNSGLLVLRREERPALSTFEAHLNDCPDIAQTIAVSCLGLGISCHLTGLHTLKIKETDRLQALKNEMEKFGASVAITTETLSMTPPAVLQEGVSVATYQDHRMAMAFAPLGLIVPLEILEAEVVSKSYPAFWEDLKTVGFTIE